MEIRSTLLFVMLSLVAAFASGCAPGYHRYSGCRVPCKYCVPSPLPYPHYDGCKCHSRPADEFFEGRQALSSVEQPDQ